MTNKMPKLFLLLMTAFFAFVLEAQYHNEWIDYNQTHYKFQSVETGLHRISYEALLDSGLSLEPENLQLFNKGEQIPIYVSSETTFVEGDFVEFYGKTNDGTLDTELFADPEMQLQDKTSLFTNFSTYFLVENEEGAHLRYTATTTDLTDVPAKEDYFMHESELVTNYAYHFGEPYFLSGSFSFFPTFDQGEGWVSGIIQETINPATGNNIGQKFNVISNGVYTEAMEEALLDITLVGRSNSTAVIFDQEIEIRLLEETLVTDIFSDFDIERYEVEVPLESIGTETNFDGNAVTKIECLGINGVGPGGFIYETKYSVAEMVLTYPRAFDFEGKKIFEFDVELDTNKYLEIENFDGGNNPVLYDLTDNLRIEPIFEDGVYKFHLEGDGGNMHSYFLSNTAVDCVFEVEAMETLNFTNYEDLSNSGNYLIISHPSLREGDDWVQAYGDYRASEAGGGHDVVIADIEELYDQFAWGIEKHPLSIRNFVQLTVNEWGTDPANLLLIGKGIHYDKTLKNEENFEKCLIPTYGTMPTDLLFVTDGVQSYQPLMAVGRIPSIVPEDIEHYLSKVQEYEALMDVADCAGVEDIAWMKRGLSLAKGWGSMETSLFLDNLGTETAVLADANCATMSIVDTITDLTGGIPSGQTNFYADNDEEISGYINNGIGMINFFGRTSVFANYWQMDVQHPSHYENEGKYPFIYSNSNHSAKIHSPSSGVDYTSEQDVMAQDWVLYENGGAIAFLGGYTIQASAWRHLFATQFYENLFLECSGSIGAVLQQTISDVYNPNDVATHLIVGDAIFVGDPAIELLNLESPELTVDVSESNLVEVTATNDSVFLSVPIANLGAVVEENISVLWYLNFPDDSAITLTSTLPNGMGYQESAVISFPWDFYGDWDNVSISLELDPGNDFEEFCEENNTYSFEFDGESVLPVECLTISDLFVEAHPCDEFGTFLVDFELNFEGDLGGYFNLYVNEELYSTFDYFSLDQNGFQTIGSFEGDGETEYVFTATDLNDDACSDTFTLDPVFCEPEPECGINNVSAEAYPCEDGGFLVALTFDFENNVSSNFSVLGNGTDYGDFPFVSIESDGFVTLGPLVGDGETVYEFVVIDNDNLDCQSFTTLESIFCESEPECSISNVFAEAYPCEEGSFLVDLSFDFANNVSSNFSVIGNGEDYGDFPFASIESDGFITLGPLVGDSTTYYEFVVIDNDNLDCGLGVELGFVDCSTTDEWVMGLNNINETNWEVLTNHNVIKVEGIVGEETLEQLKLYNINGQLIKKTKQSNQLGISGLPTGIYYLCVTTNQGEYVLKQFLY